MLGGLTIILRIVLELVLRSVFINLLVSIFLACLGSGRSSYRPE